jgi:hypothetical protein
MKIQTNDCISSRAAVVASSPAPPTITVNGDSLVSSAISGNQWYVNDTSIIAGATGQIYNPTITGVYTVQVTDNSGCALVSQGYTYVSNTSGIGLKVGPNPTTTGVFTVKFDAGTTGNFQIELYDLIGRRCFSQNYSNTGYFTTQIDGSNLITGMYILSIQLGGNKYRQKILISR